MGLMWARFYIKGPCAYAREETEGRVGEIEEAAAAIGKTFKNFQNRRQISVGSVTDQTQTFKTANRKPPIQC